MSEMEQLDLIPEERAPARGRPLSIGSLALILGILALALALGVMLSRQRMTQPKSGVAPDFQLRLFDGRVISLGDLRGHVVLINFWASWCPPCRDEAPDLQALHHSYGDAGLRVIGVNILESSPAKALSFIDEFGLGYMNGEDIGQAIARAYHVEAPPESFLIDRAGKIRRFILGALNYDDISADITSLLAESA